MFSRDEAHFILRLFLVHVGMRASRNFCQRRSKLDNIFVCLFVLVDDGREDQNTTKSGPSLARQQNAISMAFCWRADDGQPLNADLVAL